MTSRDQTHESSEEILPTTVSKSTRPTKVLKHPPSKHASSSRTTTNLQARITQLHQTISHTQRELTNTLDQISELPSFQKTTQQQQQPILSTTNTATRDFSPHHQAALDHAQRTLDDHIKLLSKYNAVKDVGMTMLGILAEQQGRPVREVMEEKGVGDDD